ncbi:MAG: ATP-dependent helicase HrpB [Rhodanobacteraceae bacterium]|jgi:ATP-dependent helicase HrpB|nr:MAG: ATP-dependent helicase HrpB [Rhodanobacteraceae bacterium]
MTVPSFPIAPLLAHVRASLAAHTRLVLEAPPGAGKTTQVPPALLDEPWLQGRKIVMLEPRRIAARAAAEFMAAQRGEAAGQTIGYRVRFESRVSNATRVEVVTEGILTRMLQDDPELPDVGAIVFDEFHERHLAGDLGAVLALDAQVSLRPDLRILVMSATLDGTRVAEWLSAPVLRSEGRAFPVRIEYPPARRGENELARLRRIVQAALAETDGDVLVFLPGRREIAQAQRMLASSLPPFTGEGARLRPMGSAVNGSRQPEGRAPWMARVRADGGNSRKGFPLPSPPPQAGEGENLEIIPLHGELSLIDQQAALAPGEAGTRRVILATNVAESSITVPGVRAVIDTGLAREPRFDPNSGFTRLATVNIAQASADQRAGRAGRVAPGVAWRMWPESRRLDASRTPEIAQAELSGLALELAAWGVGADAPASLRWLDAPPAGALAAARDLLQRLGAIDAELRITSLGRDMLQLGSTPRMAAAALRAPEPLHPLVADLLALLGARSPLRGEFNDDLRARVDALHRFRDGGARTLRNADSGALSAIEQAARGWRKRLGIRHGASGTPDVFSVGNLLLHAFPDRVAKQDANDPRRYQLANGRGARLHEASELSGEPWLVVIEARFDARDSLILAAAPFDPALLERDYPQGFTRERVVRMNASGVVEAFEERRFDAIVLERRAAAVSAEDALPALLAMIRARGIAALPWSDAATRLRTRVQWLRRALPDAGLPDVSDAALLDSLESWLAPALIGKRKLDALLAEDVSNALAGLLDWPQRKLLDEAAPDAITVPSGRTLKLDYTAAQANDFLSSPSGRGAAGEGTIPRNARSRALEPSPGAARHPLPEGEGSRAASPVLAVKLQELFGLAETPRIAHERVPVMLHLLSPAGRPIQVTQDLRGFWDRTYPEVKKELKGRYPKHPWPDDPWTAAPTHRAKPRR